MSTSITTLNQNSIIGNENVCVDATTGTAWVSQTKLAQMCGVSKQAIQKGVSNSTYENSGCQLNLSENNQLDAKSAYLVVGYYAIQNKPEAIKTLATIGEAGMQAYLYTEAGYTITVEKPIEKPIESTSSSPVKLAEEAVQSYLNVADMFGVPKQFAIIETVKSVKLLTGIDFEDLAARSPYLDQSLEEDQRLEPKELGKLVGISAIAVNKLLADKGMQVKTDMGWYPSESHKEFCHVHQWTNKTKSGYNLKWSKKLFLNIYNSKQLICAMA